MAKLTDELIKEWSWEKNTDINPQNAKARDRVWWKCKHGHEWEARIDHRLRGSGCPFCSGQRVTESNSLAFTHPEIAKEWNYALNSVAPSEVSRATIKSYWWRCKNGHEWLASVANRTRRGDKCPYCSNKVVTAETCLEAKNPLLAQEWNYERNYPLTPRDVMVMSNKLVWWRCNNSHEWEDKISNRSNGYRCSVCYPRKPYKQLSENYNLKKDNPDILIEWHPTKNGELTPDQLTPRSGKKVWWLCKICGHEWEATVDNRNGNGRGCPNCHSKTSFQEQCIYYYINSVFPDAINRYLISKGKMFEIDIFIPSLNIGIEYDGYYYHKNRKNADENKNKQLSELKIKLIRVRETNGPLKKLPKIESYGSIELECDANIEDDLIISIKEIINYISCNYNLSNINININININRDRLKILSLAAKNYEQQSLAYRYPEIAKQWATEKNGSLSPLNVTPGSNKRVWWKCSKCGEFSRAMIIRRVMGQQCPFCSGRRASSFRSLSTERPDIAKLWHPTKNGELTPSDVLPGSQKLVWWYCNSCNQEWQERIIKVTAKKGCPYCQGRRLYIGNCLATVKPHIAKLWHPTKNGQLTPLDVTGSSGKLVWWQCSCNNEYQKKVYQVKETCRKCR